MATYIKDVLNYSEYCKVKILPYYKDESERHNLTQSDYIEMVHRENRFKLLIERGDK